MGFDRGLKTAYNIVVVWNVKAQYVLSQKNSNIT